jgi:hypothetical protein
MVVQYRVAVSDGGSIGHALSSESCFKNASVLTEPLMLDWLSRGNAATVA